MFGRLLGTQKSIDNVLDRENGLLTQFGGWVNDLSHTDAEKADDRAATREWGIRQLEALAPFKVVQRLLAFAAMFMWVFVGLNYVGALWLGSVAVQESLERFAMSNYVFGPTMLVFGLYCAGGAIESFKRPKA